MPPVSLPEWLPGSLRRLLMLEDDAPESEVKVHVSYDMIWGFCGIIGDKNPIHTDPEVAYRRGFGTVIAPGTLLAALPAMLPAYQELVLIDDDTLRIMNIGAESSPLRPVRADTTILVRVRIRGVENAGKRLKFAVEYKVVSEDGGTTHLTGVQRFSVQQKQ